MRRFFQKKMYFGVVLGMSLVMSLQILYTPPYIENHNASNIDILSTQEITDNPINEPLSQFLNESELIEHDGIYINENAGFFEFPGTGTEADPYRIENWKLTIYIYDPPGIWIDNTTVHFIIRNCLIGHTGISLNNIAPNTAIVEFNQIENCTNYGVSIVSADGALVSNNYISNCTENGIEYCDSQNGEISNNIIINGKSTGIAISGINNSRIINNLIENMEGTSIIFENSLSCVTDSNMISNSPNGIFIGNSANISFQNNTISEIQFYGIELNFAQNIQISNNSFQNCSECSIFVQKVIFSKIYSNLIEKCRIGIELSQECQDFEICDNIFRICIDHAISIGYYKCNSTKVYENAFYRTIAENCHATDNGGSNQWFNNETGRGNYWEDHINQDLNFDSIADDPYPIDGMANASDLYPIINPIYNLTLIPPNISILNEESLSQNGVVTLDWNVAEIVATYRIFRFHQKIEYLNSAVSYIGSTSHTQFQDQISQNGIYYYVIIAVNGSAQSPLSNSVECNVTLSNVFISGFSTPIFFSVQ